MENLRKNYEKACKGSRFTGYAEALTGFSGSNTQRMPTAIAPARGAKQASSGILVKRLE